MTVESILERIAQGRTDLVFDLLQAPDWQEIVTSQKVSPLSWFVYYNDLTAIKAMLRAGSTLESINIDEELGHAAFLGHWKICDFLISRGANSNWTVPNTGETPLHSALSKAGRPAIRFVVRVLLESGADPNAKTIPGEPTEAFMRDVRTKGESPLHRAAAYADLQTIQLLLDHGADVEAKDAFGNSPLSWASEHLRPGEILAALAYGPHHISEAAVTRIVSDHGDKWGYGMEWNVLGEYVRER